MRKTINDVNELKKKAKEIRQSILKMSSKLFGPHTPSALSCADIVAALYFHTMNFDPEDMKNPDRDIFVLSAGHKGIVQYAALNMLGVISDEELAGCETLHSRLAAHPCYGKCPGVEASTGSLGHGIAMCNGMALAAKMDKRPTKVYTICGDGELAEGSNWDAAMFSAKYKLDNLTVIADCNNMSMVYPLDDSMPLLDLKAKFESFGFAVREINGNNMEEVVEALDAVPFEKGKPSAIIARTIKGCGVPFTYYNAKYHSTMWTEEMVEKALKELDGCEF